MGRGTEEKRLERGKGMSEKTILTKLVAAAATLMVAFGVNGLESKAAFDAPYYNINVNGGSFDGEHYVLDDGTVVSNAFFCDGTYTYFLQADGTPMKDKLTYHPDGLQIIYFDAYGHECFDTFANVKTSISGDAVDDLCYFGTTGNMFINVITYNVQGTQIYYANSYGVMECDGVFCVDVNATNYDALAGGRVYGYANADGTVAGFYSSFSEAANLTFNAQGTASGVHVTATGAYRNWDGTTNVSQFLDATGNLCYAYDAGNEVIVTRTSTGEQIRLTKAASLFGAVTCDSDGYFYVVTGEENTTEDTSVETVFLSKYDANGSLIATTGDNGSSSLARYYADSFYTKIPFHAGNCDVAVNGDYVAVNYAREMYNGHQSNSLFVVNRNTMATVNIDGYYNSHSFAQRIVPYGEEFLLASEGDAYNRAFTISLTALDENETYDWDVFHFWIEQGQSSNMYAVNNNYAHMGGLAVGTEGRAAFVATSVPSMNSNANNETENLFVQVCKPATTGISYITQGTREGYTGMTGTEYAVDEGIRFLTGYSGGYTIVNPQIVSDSHGNYIVLFERYYNYSYEGVFYMVLNGNGATYSDVQLLSSTAYLNPTEMPIYRNGTIYWMGNNMADISRLYLYSISGRL